MYSPYHRFKWTKGRQGTGYEVLTLLYSRALNADCYILRYPEGSSIPQHIDPVESGYQHFRFNLVLWPARRGGVLECEHSIFRFGPINFFRPDESRHSVTAVQKGTRYVLSIGWKRKSKE